MSGTHGHSEAVSQLLRPEWHKRRRRATGNRRVVVRRRSPVVWLSDGLSRVGRGALRVLRKLALLLVTVGSVGLVLVGGRWLVEHVAASEHFAVARVEVSPTQHVGRDELLALAGVRPGDRLLALDPDGIAARVANHPWVQSAEVRRRLPRTLAIQVVERRAAGVVNLGGLYLIDESGRPFKRARVDEAAAYPVISGPERARYLEQPRVVEAAYREALALLRTYAAVPGRPALSEVRIEGSRGFTAVLLDGGAELRLGRGHLGEKLARWDRILEAVGKDAPASGRVGLDALVTVFLDGPTGSRVSLRLSPGS